MKSICPFCYERTKENIRDFGSVIVVDDKYPVTRGHSLIIPKRHIEDFFSMSSEEKKDADRAISTLRKEVQENDPSVKGFNIGVNCGIAAGQTVLHAHIHVIPRRFGDTENPRGGIRGVIPEKQKY